MASLAARPGIRWDRISRTALLVVLLLIPLLYVSPAKQWVTQSRTANEDSAELKRLEQENHELEARVRSLQAPGALEREARKLGMVRKGERAYVIENLPKR